MLLSLPGLHYSHDNRINHILSLNSDIRRNFRLRTTWINGTNGRLLRPGRNELDSDVVVGEANVHIQFLCGCKLGFLHIFFVKNLLFGVAEIEKGIVEFFLWDG
jgi:hypothetical protein